MRKTVDQVLIAVAIIAAWAMIVLGAPTSILSTALSAVMVLVMPGYLGLKLVSGTDKRGWWATLSYSVGLSALFLMLLGLLMSVLLPLAGVVRPLTTGPLVVAIAGALTVLVLAIALRGQNLALPKVRWPQGWRAWSLAVAGAPLPLAAIAGAIILNNGGSNAVMLGMFGVAAIYMLVLAWSKRDQVQALYPYAIYMVSAALLFATSMRGWFITGHDIMQEYQVFQLTAQHGGWSMSLLQNAYTACLSITILPTILARVTGLADPYVYKLLFQLIFALMPVVLYLLLERFLPRRVALLSALVFITFPTFLTDMPMLGRQEIAFLFLVLGLYTVFDATLSRLTRSTLFLLLGVGMILSHYSTSYVAVSILLVAKVIELSIKGWEKWRKPKAAKQGSFAPLSWALVLTLVFGVYVWNSQLTKTSQGITSTIVGIFTNLPALFGDSAQTGAAAYSIVGHSESNAQLFAQYSATVTNSRDLPANNYYPASVTNQYPLTMEAPQLAPTTKAGHWLEQTHISLGNLYSLIRSSYAKLLQVLIVLGLGVMLLRRQLDHVPRQYKILGVAGLVMLGLQVALPSSIINYGLLRLLQQCLMLMAPAIIVASYMILGWLRVPTEWRVRLTALGFVGFFAVNAGLLPGLTGGFEPNLTTSNSGFYYQAYYTHADEISGYQWLDSDAPLGAVVNSDSFAARAMITYGNIYARTNLEPADISKESYVYLSNGDITFDEVPFYANGTLLYQQTPKTFLNDNKNLLYSSGAVRIYH